MRGETGRPGEYLDAGGAQRFGGVGGGDRPDGVVDVGPDAGEVDRDGLGVDAQAVGTPRVGRR